MTDSAPAPRPTSADKLASLFEDPSTADRPWWRRHRRTGFVAVALAVVLVVLLATDAFGSSGNSYRLAVVGDHDVDSLQSGVATIEPVSQATIAFPVAGTVSAVNVKVGDQVAVGQALASLDPQSLMDNLHSQQAALAQAQLTLSKALSGQSVGSSGAGGGSGASGTGGSGTGGSGANAALSSARTDPAPTAVLTAATPTDPQLATLQQAVVSAQQRVDAALAASKTALDNATSVCASAGAGGSGPPPTTAPPAAGSSGSAGTPAASAQDAGLTACQAALANVLTAQNATDTAQHELADASTALDGYLALKAATPAPTPTTTPSATGGSGGTGRTGSSGSGASGASGGSGSFGGASRSTAPSAADIASYQAAVDAATANVAAAYQAVAQGTITTPIQGTVVAVGLTPGATVTAGSTTADVVVQGAGGFEVTTSVNVTKISNVAVGQQASVVPDGSHTALPGKVTSISVAPTNVSNTATNYRVVVGLDNPNAKLGNGSTGTVTIVTKSAKASLAVPTSALTPLGRRYTVNVLQDGSPQIVVVGVGVVGARWTQVTSGLSRGQEVVLADLSQPLPSAATSSTNGTTGANGTNGLNGIGGGRFFFGGGGAGGGGIRVPGGGAAR